jgi:toxin-antitoxin system PIN domain toxin
VIAVDTNILVYAHRADLPFHERARHSVESLASGAQQWAVPWPCVHEFLAVVTNPRVFRQPSPIEVASSMIAALAASGRCEFLAEGDRHLDVLSKLAIAASVSGGQVHDARIAAICIAHGVRELWSADRDFSRYPALRVTNPLVVSAD